MPLNLAASLSGSNYLSVANYTGNPAAFSVSCWIYPNATQLSRIFFADFLNDGSNRGWAVGISDSTNNKIKFYLGSNTLFQSGTLSNIVWTHAVFTWDGTTAKIYLNGNTTPDATLTSGVNYGPVPTNNYIGSLDGTRQDFNGRLAGVGCWSKALSTTEVASLYNSGSGLSYADLSGTLPTSLVSYHDFFDAAALGTDPANAHNMANTGAVAQAFGPYGPYPAYGGITRRPARRVIRGRWRSGLPGAVTMPFHGVASVGNDAFPGTTFTTAGSLAWSRNAWGPCLNPNDSTGQGSINFGLPIAGGAAEFTLVALASTDTIAGGSGGLRLLWSAEAATPDVRLGITGGSMFFQVGTDGAFPNLNADPPRLNSTILIAARLTAAGVRSIWYGTYKVAERTDAGVAYGSAGGSLGLGSQTNSVARNWSGTINAGYAFARALSDADIMALALDAFAPERSPRMSPAIPAAANPAAAGNPAALLMAM